jgi:hypothetical protein
MASRTIAGTTLGVFEFLASRSLLLKRQRAVPTEVIVSHLDVIGTNLRRVAQRFREGDRPKTYAAVIDDELSKLTRLLRESQILPTQEQRTFDAIYEPIRYERLNTVYCVLGATPLLLIEPSNIMGRASREDVDRVTRIRAQLLEQREQQRWDTIEQEFEKLEQAGELAVRLGRALAGGEAMESLLPQAAAASAGPPSPSINDLRARLREKSRS